jgi:hypothetical protein
MVKAKQTRSSSSRSISAFNPLSIRFQTEESSKMLKKILVSATLLLPVVLMAEGAPALGGPNQVAAPVVANPLVPPAQKVCKLALLAQAESPKTYQDGEFVGRIYSATGSTLYVVADDGTTRTFTRTPWERATIGSLPGKRVVLTNIYCKKTSLDTTLKFTPGPKIEVPPIKFSDSAPVVPPLTPRPAPAPAPAPIEQPAPSKVIPQTW